MDFTNLANFLLAIGLLSPAQFEQFQTHIQTGVDADYDPNNIDDVADVFKNVVGVDTPAEIEAIGTLVLCRGTRTDSLNY